MTGLAGFQKRYLRGLGHGLRPVVVVGRQGVSDALLEKVRRELEAHELIKLRFGGLKDQGDVLAGQIAAACDSALVGRVGHTALLYRPHPDPERRRIAVPRRSAAGGEQGDEAEDGPA
jgi:RNA-binding protein